MEYKKTCAACGSFFVTKNENQTCCSSECGLALGRNKKKYYVCQYCGELFWKPDAFRKKYCSKECQKAARQDEALECHRNAPSSPAPTVYRRECLWCGEPFETAHPNKLYCSPECGYEMNKQQHREQWKAEYQPRIFTCKECGRTVETECGHTSSEFCSIECSDKYHTRAYKMRRNKQMKAAYRAPVSFKHIYNRDHGICQICGLPVPQDKSPNKLWAATIDHIVPLSKGGTHEPDNCQLSHRLCNSIKLAATQDFTIDWTEKNEQDNGRWTEVLEELDDVLLSQRIGA